MQALRVCRTRFYRLQRISKLSQHNLLQQRNLSMKSYVNVKKYPRSLSILHWTIAAGILSCFGLIEVKKREPKGSKRIGTLMHYHKSIGLLLGGLVAVRVGVRAISTITGRIPG